jgi:hypothetical protein
MIQRSDRGDWHPASAKNQGGPKAALAIFMISRGSAWLSATKTGDSMVYYASSQATGAS